MVIKRNILFFILIIFSSVGAFAIDDGDVLIASKQSLFDEAYAKIFDGYSFGRRVHRKSSLITHERGFSVRQSRKFSDYAPRAGALALGSFLAFLISSGVEGGHVPLALNLIGGSLSAAAIFELAQSFCYDDLIIVFPTGFSLCGKKFFIWDDVQSIECILFDKRTGINKSEHESLSAVRFVFCIVGGLRVQWDTCPKDIAFGLHSFMNEMIKQMALLRSGSVDYE